MANHPHNKARPPRKTTLDAVINQDMKALEESLSYRQRRFCEEYVIDFNGAAAAIRAGYSKTYADRQAFALRKNEGIRAYCDHLTRSKEAKIMAIDPNYVINSVVDIIQKEGARDGDRLRGLELLARHLGMFVDRTEITGKDGEALQIEQKKIEEDAAGFTDLIKKLADKSQSETVQ